MNWIVQTECLADYHFVKRELAHEISLCGNAEIGAKGFQLLLIQLFLDIRTRSEAKEDPGADGAVNELASDFFEGERAGSEPGAETRSWPMKKGTRDKEQRDMLITKHCAVRP